MSKAHKIESVLDMLKLSEDEFFRMLPDLCAWYAFAKSIDGDGVEHMNFSWIDDGKAGEIHSVLAHITQDGELTGEVQVIKGSAYTDEA